MAVSTKPSFESIGNLKLDPMNPRFGRRRMERSTSQEKLIEWMNAWVLDELALSYLESGGFWSHEPLIAVEESLYGEQCLVVVEGNRRLAALIALKQTSEGRPISQKWSSMLQDLQIPDGLFERVPYVLADSRADVQAFLGFRHVTGIKQWDADEKAGFITKLIDEQGMSYQQVARKIGSKSPTVRKHYVAYKVLLQAEASVEEFDPERADKRFAILYMTVDTTGAQQYLHIDINVQPGANMQPVPQEHLKNLAHFCCWLFGTSSIPNIVTDTRQVADFGRILESQEAIEYLETAKEPRFEVAFRMSGGDEEETIRFVNEAANNVELALMRAHAFKKSRDLQKAVARLETDTLQLLSAFPDDVPHMGFPTNSARVDSAKGII